MKRVHHTYKNCTKKILCVHMWKWKEYKKDIKKKIESDLNDWAMIACVQ